MSWCVYGVVFLTCSLLPFSVKTLSADGYFYITLFLSLVVGAFSGALQNSLYALAANLPPVFFQAISFGQGFSGLSTSLIMITYRCVNTGNYGAEELVMSTFQLFLLGFLLIIGSFLSFGMFMRSPYYRHYLGSSANGKDPKMVSSLPSDASEDTWTQLKIIFWNSPSRYYPLGILFVFAVTFAVFPGFLVFTESVADPTNPDWATYRGLFVTLGFLAFDLSDSIGKFMPGIPIFFIQSHTISLLANLGRLIFIPLFMWFNFIQVLNGQPFYPNATRWIRSDTLFFIIMFVFGLTNGYFSSLLLMKASSSLPEQKTSPSLREKMGKIMGLFLGFGLISGPCIAFILQATLG